MRPEVQRRIVGEVVFIPLMAFGLSVIVLGVFAVKLRGEAGAAQIELPSLLPCLIAAFGVVGIGIIGLLVQAARFSNRVVGPTVNIHRVIDAVLTGSVKQRIKLRADDYAHELAEDVNRLLARIEDLETKPRSARNEDSHTDATPAASPTGSDSASSDTMAEFRDVLPIEAQNV